MKKHLLLLSIVFVLGCRQSNPKIIKADSAISKPVVIDYARTYAVILCDTLSHEWAIGVGDKYYQLSDDYNFDYGYLPDLLTSKLGDEYIFSTYDSAMRIKIRWDSMVDRCKHQDSINILKHKYIQCK